MHGWTVSSWLDGIQMQLEREEVRINSYIHRRWSFDPVTPSPGRNGRAKVAVRFGHVISSTPASPAFATRARTTLERRLGTSPADRN